MENEKLAKPGARESPNTIFDTATLINNKNSSTKSRTVRLSKNWKQTDFCFLKQTQC